MIKGHINGPVLKPATSPMVWSNEARPSILYTISMVPSLGYLPSIFGFIPALSRTPCKCYRILHHLQRLRLHQPAFPSTTTTPTPTGVPRAVIAFIGSEVAALGVSNSTVGFLAPRSFA